MCVMNKKFYITFMMCDFFILVLVLCSTVIPDLPAVWYGSTDPCGTAMLLSIGKLGVEENKKHAAVLYDHIEKNLGIPHDR